MNKETIVIKNYILSTDMLYLKYDKEEDYNNRNYHKEVNIYYAKNKNINSFKGDGKSLS